MFLIPFMGYEFQSTLPAWGATVVVVDPGVDETISIHAPRMGSDITDRAQADS